MISQLKTLDIEIRIHINDCLINTKKKISSQKSWQLKYAKAQLFMQGSLKMHPQLQMSRNTEQCDEDQRPKNT